MKELPQILVVDDDEEIGMMIKIILEHNGYTVFIAQSADKVMPHINEYSIQLIVLDMLIGGINGTGICKQLKSDESTAHIPIMMLTALPHAEQICMEAGADAFLSKPFEIDRLLSKIEQLLR